MGVQVAGNQEHVSVTDHVLLANRLGMLVDAVNEMRNELKEKPSTTQVESMIAHLVSQRDHDAHTFRIDQQGKDLERLAKEVQTGISSLKAELLEKIEANSPKRLRENITAVVALLTGVLSLMVALGVFKRP